MNRKFEVTFDMFEPSEEIYIDMIIEAKDKIEAEVIAKQKLKEKGYDFTNKEAHIVSF